MQGTPWPLIPGKEVKVISLSWRDGKGLIMTYNPFLPRANKRGRSRSNFFFFFNGTVKEGERGQERDRDRERERGLLLMYKLDENIPLSQATLSGKHACQECQSKVPAPSSKTLTVTATVSTMTSRNLESMQLNKCSPGRPDFCRCAARGTSGD